MDQQGHQKKNQPKTNAPGGGNNRVGSTESDLPFWSAGVSGGRAHKQGVSPHSVLGASPLIPAVIVIVGIVALVYTGWLRQGIDATSSLPAVEAVSALFQKKPPAVPGVLVWVRKESGFYYCHGDVLFGRKPGKLQTQSEAITSGYRPAGGQYCTDGKRNEASAGAPSSRTLTGTK